MASRRDSKTYSPRRRIAILMADAPASNYPVASLRPLGSECRKELQCGQDSTTRPSEALTFTEDTIRRGQGPRQGRVGTVAALLITARATAGASNEMGFDF